MRRRGFTLLEMMTVVAIVGIISALAAPNLIGMVRSTRVSGELATLVATLNAARSQAVTSGLPTVVCMRGPSYAGTTGDEVNLVEVYRKSTVPAVIDNFTAGHDTTDKNIDRRLMDPLTVFQFPTAPVMDPTKSLQFIFDVPGTVTLYVGDNCTPAADASRSTYGIPAAGVTFTALSSADATITRAFVLRTDGTTVTP